ncbi:MAG: TPM domain-containing protein [Candidatus Saccharimonadales bacterium]
MSSPSKRLRRAALALLFFLSPIFMSETSASAADDTCTQTVVDDGNLLGDQKAAVDQAANSLASKVGAVVFVRTNTNAGPIDNWLKPFIASCKNWQSDGYKGGTEFKDNARANILVFGVSTNPNGSLIGWGGSYDGPMTGANIRNNVMNPQLKAGNYARGIIDGMNETGRVIDAYRHPIQRSGDTPASSSPLTVAPDSSGLWKILGWLIGLAGVGVALHLCWRLYSRIQKKRKDHKAFQAARQDAWMAHGMATGVLEQLAQDEHPPTSITKVKFLKELGGDYRSRASALAETIARSTEEARAILATSPDPSTVTSADTQTWRVLADRYSSASRSADQAVQTSGELHTLYAEALRRIGNVKDDAAELNKQLDAVEMDTKSLGIAGIKVDSILASVTQARTALMNATEMTGQPASLSLLEEARKCVITSQASYESLVSIRQLVSDGIVTLRSRLEGYDALLQAARQVFDEKIKLAYNPESWKPIKGNGVESQKRANQAAARLEAALAAATMDKQEWKTANDHLVQGSSLMDEAEGLLRSIHELEKNLERAKTELPLVIARVRDALTAIDSDINKYGGDIEDSLWNSLEGVRATLRRVRSSPSERQPRYLTNLKLALEAEEIITRIHEQVVMGHDAAEQRREHAQSALAAAKAEVSRAREYIDDHKSDVNRDAKEHLRGAMSQLAKAKTVTRPNDILAAAQSATRQASLAYKKARKDFEDAEDERDRSYRSSTVVVGGYSSDNSTPYNPPGWGSPSPSGGGSDSGGFGGGGGTDSGGF